MRRLETFFSLLDCLLLLLVILPYWRFGDDQENANRRLAKMTISRKLGVLVFCAVPGIIGGGIVYAALFMQFFITLCRFSSMNSFSSFLLGHSSAGNRPVHQPCTLPFLTLTANLRLFI
jgi:hypothetical protein